VLPIHTWLEAETERAHAEASRLEQGLSDTLPTAEAAVRQGALGVRVGGPPTPPLTHTHISARRASVALQGPDCGVAHLTGVFVCVHVPACM
jgi:hypothetical protein